MIPDQTLLSIIDELRTGQTYSGEALGARLGISRAAIWKQLQKLEGLGIAVDSVRGQGYRIPGGLDLLEGEEIARACAAFGMGEPPPVVVHPVIDSTNRIAMDELLGAGVTGTFHFAECQTAGRGRRGRRWVSPYGASLYLSVGWEFEEGVAALVGLSLALGVACRRALARLGAAEVQLKWPNDLLVNGAKLGGILVEIAGDPSDCCRIVAGVGLNVRTPDRAGMEIDQSWVNLDNVTTTRLSRNHLAAALVVELSTLLASYGPGKFAEYRDEWLAGDALAGREVILSTPSHQLTGVARGVDETGAILIERDGQVLPYSGGELSLRVAPS